jgi:HEPN domain-containing protein
MPDSTLPKDWFERASHDLIDAQILFKASGHTDTIGVLLQQAFEKYIKGYLLSKGWRLKKIHDLRELIFRAQEYNPAFYEYLELARKLTAIYIEEHYPTAPSSGISKEEITLLLAQTEKLIDFIKQQTN